jgi:hypothetical protein
MPSFAAIALEWLDRNPDATVDQKYRLYDEITPVWFDTHFAELCERCPSARFPELPRRPGNALNIEIGQPMTRCLERSPDGRGLIWLLSGGSLLAYGICCRSGCPRTKVYEHTIEKARQPK